MLVFHSEDDTDIVLKTNHSTLTLLMYMFKILPRATNSHTASVIQIESFLPIRTIHNSTTSCDPTCLPQNLSPIPQSANKSSEQPEHEALPTHQQNNPSSHSRFRTIFVVLARDHRTLKTSVQSQSRSRVPSPLPLWKPSYYAALDQHEKPPLREYRREFHGV